MPISHRNILLLSCIFASSLLACDDLTWHSPPGADGEDETPQVCEEEETSCEGEWKRICEEGRWVRSSNCADFGWVCRGGTCVNPLTDGDESDTEPDGDTTDQTELEEASDGDATDEAELEEASDGDTTDEAELEEAGDGDTADQAELEEISDGDTADQTELEETSDGDATDEAELEEAGDGDGEAEEELEGEVVTCDAGQCKIENACHDDGTENPANECQTCASSESADTWTNLGSETSCDDEAACTYSDQCNGSGECSGTAYTCHQHGACNGDHTCACDLGYFPPRCEYWSRRFGEDSDDKAHSVAWDGSGNVFITGYFSGSVDFGGGTLTSAGEKDIFLAKYSSTGAHQWSKRFGGSSNDYGQSVAVDGSGNVFVTGSFQGSVDFGGGGLTSAGQADIFLAKYSSTGAHQWSQRFGGGAIDSGGSIAVDGSGNVIVTGWFYSSSVDFGGGTLTRAGGCDIFLAQYSSAGSHVWSKRFGSSADDAGYSVAVDVSGNVFVTGCFYDMVNFGGETLTSAGNWDIFLAKYSTTGSHLWSQRFGGSSEDRGYPIAIDGSGDVFISGFFQGSVDFGGGTLTSAGQSDIFLAKYSSAGGHQWSQRFGGFDEEIGQSLAVDGSGNVFVTGRFNDAVDFGGGTLTSAGGNDIFLAQYSSAGGHQWSQRFGGSSSDEGQSVAVDGSGNVFITGDFSGSVDFGGGTLNSAGNRDVFLLRLPGDGGAP